MGSDGGGRSLSELPVRPRLPARLGSGPASPSSKPSPAFPFCKTVGKPGSLRGLCLSTGAVGTGRQARIKQHREGSGLAGRGAESYKRVAAHESTPVLARISHTFFTHDLFRAWKGGAGHGEQCHLLGLPYIAKGHRRWLEQQEFLFPQSWRLEAQGKVLAGLVPPQASPRGLQTPASPCPRLAVPLCVSVSSSPLCIKAPAGLDEVSPQ